MSPHMVAEREKHNRNKPNTLHLPPGMVFYKRGDVIQRSGGEWVCESVSNCNASFINLTGKIEILKFKDKEGEAKEKTITKGRGERTDLANCYTPGQVIRVMTEDEIQAFLTRGNTRQVEEQTQTQGISETKNTDMSKNKTNGASKVKVDKNISGSSEFVRACVAKGMTKEDTRTATIKKWPIFESGDKEGFESRWRTGVKVFEAKQKKEKAAEKAAAKGTPAKAPKASAKPAAKATTKPKGKGGKKSSPPARTAAPTAPAKPVGGPPPRATLPPASTPEPEATTEAPAEPTAAS
jgi:hypothetical protein